MWEEISWNVETRREELTLSHIGFSLINRHEWEIEDQYTQKAVLYELRVICERCIRLCHKDDLKMKTIRISCILCAHIHWVTSPFMIMCTDAYTMMMIIIMPHMTRLRIASSTMMGLEGCKSRLGIHASTCGSCIGKYYTSNFVPTRDHPYDDFNNRSLIMSCMCLHSLTP